MRTELSTVAFLALAAILVGCAPSAEDTDRRKPAADRIHSSTGFSFLPPPGDSWTEKFGENEIIYLKQTDPEVVSFFAGALEGQLASDLEDKDALVTFVQARKDQWGNDGRYSNTTSSFQVDVLQGSCVRYQLSARDRGARNLGRHEFLVMTTVGKFCLHPEDPQAAVDIYYSVRHAPAFDPRAYVLEGEDFLRSLQFSPLPLARENIQ